MQGLGLEFWVLRVRERLRCCTADVNVSQLTMAETINVKRRTTDSVDM